jgi:hypothetical protein
METWRWGIGDLKSENPRHPASMFGATQGEAVAGRWPGAERTRGRQALLEILFDMMMTYTQIDNLNVTHSKHAYLNKL